MADLNVTLGEGITGLAISAMEVVTLDDERHVDSRLPEQVHQCFAGEGIISLMCAPVFHQGQLTGNLLVGYRRRVAVPQDARYLLSALSSQAATAIAHTRLYASLREQNELLEQHVALSRTLTEASLAGGGQHAIAKELARAIGMSVVVQHDAADVEAAWFYDAVGSEPRLLCGDEEGLVADDNEAAAIRAGGERWGHIRSAGPDATSEFHRAALGLGATAIALEISKEHAALEGEWRVRGELLEELLQASDALSDGLRRRAAHANIDVDVPRSVAIIEGLAGSDLDAVYALLLAAGTAEGVMVGRRGEQLIVAVPGRHRPHEWVTALMERAHKKGSPVRSGLSDAHVDLPRALREATGALNLARRSERGGVLVDAQSLGPLRFLLDAPDTTQMTDVVTRTLGPLARYDKKRNGDLLPTLRAFLDSGGNHPTAAEKCHVHLNTVKYRMGRVAEVLDCNLSHPDTRFELSMAFAVADVLEAVGVSPLK
jgi:DNA-binding PucR family transcriptional regulator